MEKPLIYKTPKEFKGIDINKLKSKDTNSLLKLFYTLKYPASTWFYHNIIGIGTEQKWDVDIKLKFYKHLCEQDLYYFAKYLLNKDKLREKPNRLMAEKIMIRQQPNQQERKLICEPRGTYKTTLGSFAYPIWKLCKNNNFSFLIMSETDRQAHTIYKTVKDELESNRLLIKMYGVFKSDRWNETSCFINQRTKISRDPSLMHCGCDSSINGLHPDEVVVDDPCSEQNTQTAEGMDKVYDSYKLLTPLVDKIGQILIIMTRWVLEDLAGKILDNEKDNFSVISIKSCYGEDGHGKDKNDGAYAPDVISLEFLEAARSSMGMWRFSANYMNDPKPDTDKSFKMEWLKYYDTDVPLELGKNDELRPIPLSIYMSMDASWADKSSNTGRDPTAIVVAGFDAEGTCYLLDIFNKRISPTEVIEKVFQLYSIWQPISLATEDIGTQKGLNKQIEDEMTARGVYFLMDRVKHQARGKASRIMNLTPMFEKGHIYAKKEFRDFIEQYQYYNPVSNIAHDDILDALEQLVDIYRDVYLKPDDAAEKEFFEEFYSRYDRTTGRM